MATRDQITADIALDIEGNLPPTKFLTGVKAFFNLVQAINDVTTRDGKSVQWTVEVMEGSAVVALRPKPGCARSDVEAIERTVKAGVETLETGRSLPDNFPESGVRHLRALGSIVGRTEKDDTRVRVWINQEPQNISLRTVANAVDILGMQYEDYGSVEGKLQAVSARGGLRFVLYDPLWDRAIQCLIGADLLNDALSNFRKRVEAYGIVQYRKDGQPVSVRVDELIPFPPEKELPEFRSLRGILCQEL